MRITLSDLLGTAADWSERPAASIWFENLGVMSPGLKTGGRWS